MRARRGSAALLAALVSLGGTGCGASTGAGTTATIPATLLAGLRPIGSGPRFHPPVHSHVIGRCLATPGPEEAHIELFAENRVVLIGAGVGISTAPVGGATAGVRSGRRRCYGAVVTLSPTGAVHFRPGATLSSVFGAWGEPYSATRLASFTGRVRYYLDGRRVRTISTLTQHAEIVLEVGPYVPPHASYSFPEGL